MVTSAFLLNRIVLPRCVGLVNLANMMPVTQAVMNTPMTLWTLMTRMAPGHRVLVIRPPYLESLLRIWKCLWCQDSQFSPNGVLCLHTEKKGRGEVHYIVNTDHMVRLLCIKVKVTFKTIRWWIYLILDHHLSEFTMLPGNEVPNNTKQ